MLIIQYLWLSSNKNVGRLRAWWYCCGSNNFWRSSPSYSFVLAV